MTSAHVETYKNHEINIEYDENPSNPRTEWDNFGKMVCWHPRYNLGDEQPAVDIREWLVREVLSHPYPNLSEDDNGDYSWEVKVEDASLNWLLTEFAKKNIVRILHLYDHSGLSISTHSFVGRAQHAEWDSACVGIIYVSKDDARKEFWWKNITHARILKIEALLDSEVSVYDSYLRGDVYGYTIEGDLTSDSCWGYYGDDGEDESLKEAKSIIDYSVKLESERVSEELRDAQESAWGKVSETPIGAC